MKRSYIISSIPLTIHLLFILAITVQITTQQDTVLILEIARHGTRAPVSEILKADWMEGLQESDLTPSGMRQHYYAGLEMKNRFPQIFTQNLSRNEVWLRSSLRHRTIISANSHFVGFMEGSATPEKMPFSPEDPRITPPGLKMDPKSITFTTAVPNEYNPVAIYSPPKVLEEMLIPLSPETCSNGKTASSEFGKKFKTELVQSKGFMDMLNEAAKKFGVDVSKESDKFKTCEKLADFMVHDYLNNPKPILDATDPLFPRLVRCLDFTNVIMFMEPRLHRVSISALLQDILSKIKRKTSGDASFALKYALYSTHDTVLAPVLMAAKAIDAQCFYEDLKAGTFTDKCGEAPQTAGNIVFELRNKKDSNNEYEVVLYYDLKPVNFCGAPACSLQQFEKWVQENTEENYRVICDPSKEKKEDPSVPKDDRYWKIGFFVGLAVFLLEVVFLIAICSCRKRFVRSKESQIQEEKDANDSDYIEVEDVKQRKSQIIKV